MHELLLIRFDSEFENITGSGRNKSSKVPQSTNCGKLQYTYTEFVFEDKDVIHECAVQYVLAKNFRMNLVSNNKIVKTLI